MRGSCHCGRIAYSLDAEPTEAIECNCSICRRRGSVLAAFTPDKFHLETSRDDIAVYTFGQACHPPPVLQDLRVRAVRRGDGPRRRGDGRGQSRAAPKTLDLSTIRITPFDGASLVGLLRWRGKARFSPP